MRKQIWFCIYLENHKKYFVAVTTTKYYFTATAAVRRLFVPILAERTFLAIYSCWKINFTNVSIVVTEKGKILLPYLLRRNILLRMILLKKKYWCNYRRKVCCCCGCFVPIYCYRHLNFRKCVILIFFKSSHWFPRIV